MRRHRKRGLSPFAAGIVGIVITLAVVYFGFTKAIPFKHHFTVNAVFQTSNNLKKNSPVRIAGVNVGKVVGVQHLHGGEPQALVKMRIDAKGRPIHKDASFAIRPRIFLEGNFFVDVQPGTPSAPELGDGDTVEASRTTSPVQFDQILTTLQSDTRENLKKLLAEYSTGLAGPGGQGFNKSIGYWESAYKNSAIVNDATLGSRPHDLSGYIKGSGVVAQALDNSPQALKDLITNFNITARAFAIQQANLSATVAELPRTLRAAEPALRSLNDAFPSVRRLAVDFDPAVKSSLPAINASLPFVAQARRLVSEPELKGLVRDLKPTVPALARLNASSIGLYGQVRLASSCQNEVILPWTHDQLKDPFFPTRLGGGTTQLQVYQEATRALDIGGESRTGDANQQWFRVLPGNGASIYNLTGVPGAGAVYGATTAPLLGTQPGKLIRPALRPLVPCETQVAPNLTTTPQQPPQKVSSTPNSAFQKKGQALITATLAQQMRRQSEPNPTPAQALELKSTQAALDALRASIQAEIKPSGTPPTGFKAAQ